MKNHIAVIAFLCFAAISAKAQQHQVDTVYLSELYTTHIIFSTEISYADVSNLDDITANYVEQNKNMFAIMAIHPFKTTASCTILESNGTIHTFILAYMQHPRNLIIERRPEYMALQEQNELPERTEVSTSPGEAGKPAVALVPVKKKGVDKGKASQSSNLKNENAPELKDVVTYERRLWHLASKRQKLEFTCYDIFCISDIMYITLHLENDSGISFETNGATFVIESNNKAKRKMESVTNIIPKNRFGTLTTAPGEKSTIAYSFEKFTLNQDQLLTIHLYEKNGQRHMTIILTPTDVNMTKR